VAFLSGDNDREKPYIEKLAPKALYYRFNQSPFDKLNFIRQLNLNGHQTVMVGDGLNDAGALKQSHFGIAVAQQLHHFAPASDAILQENHLTRLPYFIAFSKVAVKVVKVSFLISFLYNVVGISLAVQGLLSPIFAAILMPLSSITIVAFTTLSIQLLSSFYLKKYET
jgi:Cu+-exporting ATPase